MRTTRFCFGVRVERLSGDGENLRDCPASRIAGIGPLAGANLYASDESIDRPRRKYFVRTGGLPNRERARVACPCDQPGDLPARGWICGAARDLAGGYKV